MLIKIAIFTVIGLLSVVLLRFWGPGIWRKLRRALLEQRLTDINYDRERILRLQRILELPDAYERLLVEGIVAYGGPGRPSFIAAPGAREVRAFIEGNGVNSVKGKSGYSLPHLMEKLCESEDHVQGELYVIAERERPANRDLYMIEQRSKVEQLVRQLAAERQQLEKLEVLDRSPDPYGRLPKSREEPRAAEGEPEPELAEATEPRKMRA